MYLIEWNREERETGSRISVIGCADRLELRICLWKIEKHCLEWHGVPSGLRIVSNVENDGWSEQWTAFIE